MGQFFLKDLEKPRLATFLAPCLVAFGVAFFTSSIVRADDPRIPDKGRPAEGKVEAIPGEGEKDAEAGAETTIYDELDVQGRADDLIGIADSATEGATGREDLDRRPILRTGELLETVPGVIVTQHSGSGKANQYFLRGFNLDHGTDLRLSVDGMQVNFPSHGHGQGYIDLNFLIPELVQTVTFRKGSYNAEDGDFSAAGAADMELLSTLDHGLLSATLGSFDFQRLVLADSWAVGSGNLLGAVEVHHYDGPWRLAEDSRKTNALVRLTQGDANRGFSATAMGYDSRWNSTDQIPLRAVRSGALSRFGFIDESDGGDSDRQSLSITLRRGGETTLDHAHFYALSYSLRLFSNFSYFLDDPENGDQFEQDDDRTAAGFEVHKRWSFDWRGRASELEAGFQGRGDWIDNGLFSTRARRRLSTTRSDEIRVLSIAPFVQSRVNWNPWLRTVFGLRADAVSVSVESDLAANSDDARDEQVSPRFSIVFGPWKSTEISLNYGIGFHSNDARGTTVRIDPKSGDPAVRIPLLVKARTADLGIRFQPVPTWNGTLSFFETDFDSELVFVGDAGGTEAGRPSRRRGVELANFWRPRRWLSIDADITFASGRFTDEDPAGDRIPGAIDRTIAAGIAIHDVGRVSGAVRVRHFGPRDLIEDGSVRSNSSTLVNAELSFELAKNLHLELQGFNLFDQEASDIDYYYRSRLPGEPDEGIDDVHFHSVEPRAARLSFKWDF